MSPLPAPRLRSILLALALVLTAAACQNSHDPTSEPSTSAPTKTSSDACHDVSGVPRVDGPIDWQAYGTLTFKRAPASSSDFFDFGLIPLYTTEPVVLDRVTVQHDPKASPLRFRRAFVSTDAKQMEAVPAGKWKGTTQTVACFDLTPVGDDLASAPVLIVRLAPSSPRQVNGHDFSRNLTVTLDYHSRDGTPYSAPFGLQVQYPNFD